MNKKAAIIAGVAVVGLLGVFALGGNKKDSSADVAGIESVTITHELGNTEVVTNPERVVVFDYPTLDTLDALGIDAVVGVPGGNLPEALEKYEGDEYAKVGTIKEPDLEAIMSAEPDLIVISGRQSDYYDELNKIAPTIYVGKDNDNYVTTMIKNIEDLGIIFGIEDKVAEEIAIVEEKIADVRAIVEAEDVEALTIMVNEGSLSVYGDTSRYGLLYQGFGFKNADNSIDDSTHGQVVTFEYLAEVNPEYIFVLDRDEVVLRESTAENVLDNDIVKMTDAYNEDKIVYLDASTWYTNDGGLSSINIMIDDVVNGLR